MKSLLFSCVLGALVCLALASVASATLVSGSDKWGISLGNGESYTAIAHYALDSVGFTRMPQQTADYQEGGWWNNIGWKTILYDAEGTVVEVDDEGWVVEPGATAKWAYMYGPQITNTIGEDVANWFIYSLYYEWDDEAEGFDPDWPVYIDTAVFDGLLGAAPTDYWGWRGTPGDPGSWEYRDEPYYKDDPAYEEGFFDNKTPEPATVCLLGLGGFFLMRRRR
ncbi:MAG: PEP-CTERM sorting domain-containing protein [Planctomycetota bacterium]|nr:MAG: PEP-CTERM sorting domain-containing protein [Planctomycetota bacterium]